MEQAIRAVIFDMDGVLINSEGLWRKAMMAGFKQCGMDISEEQCRSTMGMRFGEVVRIWLDRFRIRNLEVKAVEELVIDLLLALIEKEGAFIPGIPGIIAYCNEKRLLMGIATSSSEKLMNAVLRKLGLEKTIHQAVSAEHLPHGKPHPEVFLICAGKLGVSPQECLVIEDSLNGVIAARAAQMTVIAVPDEDHAPFPQFAVAHYKCLDMQEALEVIKKRCGVSANLS
jgi:sugar-phosphatase